MKSQILAIALAFAPLAASTWPSFLPDIDSLVVRQDDQTNTRETSAVETETPSPPSNTRTADDATITDEPATSHDPEASPTTNLNTGGRTQTGTQSGSKTTGTKAPTHKTYDPADGFGSVAMVSPATTAGTTLYRIDNPTPITWVWNYTSLQGTPSAVDVMISCSKATATWTLTQNMTFEPTATFTWNSNDYQNQAVESPLLVEQYTLLIIDSDSSVSATAEAGYLAPYSGFQFGMYTAKPYEALGEWKCATCSAASRDLDRKSLGFALTMCMVTVLSFTWYVTGFAALL